MFNDLEEEPFDVQAAVYDNNDPSKVLPYRRLKETEPSRFATVLGLWYKEAAISRVQYKSLVELLRMPEIQAEVESLLSCISILKKQAKARLLLMKMRSRLIPLKGEKQSRQKEEEDLIMFDPVYLFTTSK